MKALMALAAVAALGGGLMLAEPGLRHWRYLAAADDPAALSALRLDSATDAVRLGDGIDEALAAQDVDLAQSYLALADERGIAVSSDRRTRIAEAGRLSLITEARSFGAGFWTGQGEGASAFAGVIAGDLSGFGDLRDLAREGRHWLDGREPDALVIGVAAAGLALSAATVASFGGGLPARQGLSIVKSVGKAKLIAPALRAQIGRVALASLDRPALETSLKAAARFDLAAARLAAGGIVRPAALGRLTALGGDAATLLTRSGQRALTQTLKVSENLDDVRRAAKLSAAKPASFRASLAILGRGALTLGGLALTIAGWLFTLALYAIGVAMAAQRFGFWLGRRRPSSSGAAKRRPGDLRVALAA